MKETAPLAMARGITTGAATAANAENPTAVALTTTAPEATPPRSAPAPVATNERPALTSSVPVRVRESFSPVRPIATAWGMLMVCSFAVNGLGVSMWGHGAIAGHGKLARFE